MSSSSSATSGAHSHAASQPCDHCSSIAALSLARRLDAREAARLTSVDAASASSERTWVDDEEESEDEDERDRLVLPEQRILMPMMSPRIKQVLFSAFAILVCAVMRGVWRDSRR
jgi:hypothetical protein